MRMGVPIPGSLRRGGMTGIRILFLFFMFVAGLVTGPMIGILIIPILIYGSLGGPCVWPLDDAVSFGVDLSTLEWSVALQCYLDPNKKPLIIDYIMGYF